MDGKGGDKMIPKLLHQIQELERRLVSAEADNRRKDQELEQAYHRAGQATEEVELGKEEIQRIAQDLKHGQVQCELEMHEVEALRQEHAEQLKYEHCQWERECTIADNMLEEVKSRFEKEKSSMKCEFKVLNQIWPLQKGVRPIGDWSTSIPVKCVTLVLYILRVYPDPN